ncbi:MAG TPA: hypothetical protein VMG82_19340, partial [Candidatus Sulfotelmatobacter sp.]|nr:hypothetical protein [Candidatus Sulfotelmatobacter sp.]HTT21095.1 hypothetical protein [Candidatus Sulfotelmatobacter sp.]
MTLREKTAERLRPAYYLGSNPVTLTGAVLTTSSALTIIGFWLFEVVGGGPVHPYLGLIFFLILPGIFVLGLLLMPIGALWRRRSLRRTGSLPATYPPVDLAQPMVRTAIAWVGGLTMANVVIFGMASYRGVEYMDSVKFCG